MRSGSGFGRAGLASALRREHPLADQPYGPPWPPLRLPTWSAEELAEGGNTASLIPAGQRRLGDQGSTVHALATPHVLCSSVQPPLPRLRGPCCFLLAPESGEKRPSVLPLSGPPVPLSGHPSSLPPLHPPILARVGSAYSRRKQEDTSPTGRLVPKKLVNPFGWVDLPILTSSKV